MRKRISLFLMVLIATISFAACSGPADAMTNTGRPVLRAQSMDGVYMGPNYRVEISHGTIQIGMWTRSTYTDFWHGTAPKDFEHKFVSNAITTNIYGCRDASKTFKVTPNSVTFYWGAWGSGRKYVATR